jgi:hypothetical protein
MSLFFISVSGNAYTSTFITNKLSATKLIVRSATERDGYVYFSTFNGVSEQQILGILAPQAGSTLAANSRQLKKRVLPSGIAWCATPCGKTRFLPRLAASISNWFGAARGSTPAASVRSTRRKTWRQKPLDAA